MGVTGYLGQPQPLTGTLDGPVVRGYSAYEIYKQSGGELTEAEWLASLRGPRGYTGAGIKRIIPNADYTLTIVMDDEEETEYTTDPIRGATGKQGIGIADVKLNDDFTLTITLDDDEHTEYKVGPIRGAKGDAYILTAQDKADIYNLLLNDYPAVEEVSF